VLRSISARAFDNKGEETRWVGWYVRQQLRQAGLPALSLDGQGLATAKDWLTALAARQKEYHERASHRAHGKEHRLEFAGAISFVLAFLVGLAALTVPLFWHDILSEAKHAPGWINSALAHLKPALGTAAIILPAFGSALLGIRLIADYAGVAARSHQAADVFDAIVAHLAHDPLDLRHLRARAAEIAEISLRDVFTWRMLAESRKLDWPG
jgi:hypothetical protein